MVRLGRVGLRYATLTQGPCDDQPRTALGELLVKGTDASVLREIIGFAAECLMELAVGDRTGAAHGERNAARRRAGGVRCPDPKPMQRWRRPPRC